MRAAVSTVEPIFQAAKQLAKENGIPRGQRSATAIFVYLKAHLRNGITVRLNKIYEEATPTPIDPVIQTPQLQSLPQHEG